MIGSHFIKEWSRTQNHVTLSSAEARLIALVKCSAETLGICAALRDWSQEKTSTLFADSSGALATAKRKGAGKLRHIHISALWIQDIQDREGTAFHNILGTLRPVDLMTKYLSREKIDGCLATICQRHQAGRADMGLNIQKRERQQSKFLVRRFCTPIGVDEALAAVR